MKSAASIDLSLILSSQARFRVLQTLVLLTEGMGLRELERQTRLSIRSVQVAVQSLVAERILKKDSKKLLRLNTKSPAAELLQGLFKYLRDTKVCEDAKMLSERARWTLQLSDEVRAFVHHARRSD